MHKSPSVRLGRKGDFYKSEAFQFHTMATHVLYNPENGIDFPYSDALKASRPDLVEKWFECGVEVPPPASAVTASVAVELPKSENTVTSINIEFVPGNEGKVRGDVDLPGVVIEKEHYDVTVENVTLDDIEGKDVDQLLNLARQIGISYDDVRPTFDRPCDFNKYLKRDIKRKINQIMFARQRAEAARAVMEQKGVR